MDILSEIIYPKTKAFLSLEVIIILIITFMMSFTLSNIFQKLYRNRHINHSKWGDILFNATKTPLQLLIYTIGFSIALEATNKHLKSELIDTVLGPIKILVIVGTLLWFVINIINKIEHYWFLELKEHKTKLDKTTISAITKLFRISSIIIASLIALESFGFSISGLIAFGGAGGVAIGFAAKDMLANFFGAIMIYLDKPFKIGEWVRIPEKDIEGEVEKIGARCTVIKTLDKRPLYVPNSLFSYVSIENPSRMSHRRINEVIGLRYEDLHVVGKVMKRVEKVFTRHPKVDTDMPLIVNLHGFTPTSINILLYAFVTDTELVAFHKVKQELMLKVAKIVEECEAEFAQYTNVLSLPEEFYESAPNYKKPQSAAAKPSDDDDEE